MKQSINDLQFLNNDSTVITPIIYMTNAEKLQVRYPGYFDPRSEFNFSLNIFQVILNKRKKFVCSTVITDVEKIEADAGSWEIFSSLKSHAYKDFIDSYNLIFHPFKRFILKFEKDKQMTIGEFQNAVLKWHELEVEGKQGSNI